MSVYNVKLSPFSDSDTEQHRKAFGDYASFPPNFREITEQEFVDMAPFTWGPAKIEFRQMMKEHGVPALPAQLYFFRDGTGYAMSTDHKAHQVHYYRFGCEHEYKSLTRAECHERNIYHGDGRYHVRECAKCGYLESLDSSD